MMTSPPSSERKKKKKKKKKKEMTLADAAGLAMAGMAPQAEIGLIQSPSPPSRKGGGGGGHPLGDSAEPGDVPGELVSKRSMWADARGARGRGGAAASAPGLDSMDYSKSIDPGSGAAPCGGGSQSQRTLGARSSFKGMYGGVGAEAGMGDAARTPMPKVAADSLAFSRSIDVDGASRDNVGSPPLDRGDTLSYTLDRTQEHRGLDDSHRTDAAAADEEVRGARVHTSSGGSGIIGDALLDSIKDDIGKHQGGGPGGGGGGAEVGGGPVKPRAIRPPQLQGQQGQKPPAGAQKGTISGGGPAPSKATGGGGANKAIPRPGVAKRVSSFGPGGGHTYNAAQESAAQVREAEAGGGKGHHHHHHHHKHGGHGGHHKHQQEEEINAFSSMVLSEDSKGGGGAKGGAAAAVSGYGATADIGGAGHGHPKTPPPTNKGAMMVRKSGRALPEQMEALSPSPSYEVSPAAAANKGGGSVASSGGGTFDGIEKGGFVDDVHETGRGGLGGGNSFWHRCLDARLVLFLWGPHDPPYKECPPDMDPEEYEMYPELDLSALPPLRRGVMFFLFDPLNPELTSTQQFCWACLIGAFFGVLTACWGFVIEGCVDIMWEKVPETLLEWGWFTDLEGAFPLPHYMWVCPMVCGGVLACITALLPKPIPDQNEWIYTLHKYGVMESDTFVNLILTATAGMASGLSLGPELPLVLASGMVGSWLGLRLRQSILSARVLNLTAGAAAIGGFFGFPMAGALFVLELPHQMGLQYFEALSPATISSIVAVLVNRMVTGNDIKGYFNYPFLTASLPSHIFYIAILYGVVGAIIGIIYADGVKWLKTWVHDWFHYHEEHHHDDEHHDEHHDEGEDNGDDGDGERSRHENGEDVPLVGKPGLVAKLPPKKTAAQKCGDCLKPVTHFSIRYEPLRAFVVGIIAGGLTGLICMFLPHNLFWGEAQLQTIIDNGRTPLPVFGEGDEPTAMLTAYGYCMIDPEDEEAVAAGFSWQCMGMISFTKILTIGLSIGTGIIGGHFWGPLYTAAAGSRFFLDLMVMMTNRFGFGATLSTYPCVAILCIMGSAHVVTFRAHMAIMLILTLTISAFTPEDDSGASTKDEYVGGDYSAVFPLLVVSCFVSLMTTRSHQFYKKQQCRGDIDPKPEVLCEPMKEGMPWLDSHQLYGADYDSESWDGDEDGEYAEEDDVSSYSDGGASGAVLTKRPSGAGQETTQEDIEREFMQQQQKLMNPSGAFDAYGGQAKPKSDVTPSTVGPSPSETEANSSDPFGLLPSKRLDELLAANPDNASAAGRPKSKRPHRRTTSDITGGVITITSAGGGIPSGAPGNRVRSSSSDRRAVGGAGHKRSGSVDAKTGLARIRTNSRDGRGTPTGMARISSFGEVQEFQPSLMDQARRRASSVNRLPVPPPGQPRGRHSRQGSNASGTMLGAVHQRGGMSPVEAAGALSAEDLERGFSAALNQSQNGGGGGRR